MKNVKFLNRPIVFEEPELIIDNNAWLGHIPFAFWIVDALRPKNLVELGTHAGSSYCAFAQAVKTLKLEAACFAVDTWQGDPHSGFYGDEVLRDLAVFHDARYASFSRLIRSTFDDALGHFPDRGIDLLHIDGYHTYEAITHDFNSWLPKVSDRGVMLFHDVNVRERDFGAWRFWDEVKTRYPSFTFLHSHGLGVLAVGKKLPPAVRWLVSQREESPDAVSEVRRFFGRLGGLVNEVGARRQLGSQVARLSNEVCASQAQIASLTADFSTLRAHLAERDEQVRSIENDRQALRNQLTQSQQVASGQEERIKGLEGEVSVAHAAELQRETELTQTQGELAQRSAQIQQIEAEMHNLRDQVTQRQTEVAGRDERIKGMEDELAQLRADVALRAERVQLLELAHQQMHDQLTQAHVLLSDRDQQIRGLDQEMTVVRTVVSERDTELAQARGELAQRSTLIQQIEAEMHSLRDQVAQRQTEVAGRDERIKGMENELAQLRTDMAQVRGDLEQQITRVQQSEAQTQQLQDQLAQSQILVGARDQRIEQFEQALAAAQVLMSRRDAQLTALLQDLARKDAELFIHKSEAQGATVLAAALEEKERDLLDLNTRLSAALEQLSTMQVEMYDRSATITRLTKTTEYREHRLGELEKRFADAQAELTTLRVSLRERDLHNSSTLAAVAEKTRTLRLELERLADAEQQRVLAVEGSVRSRLTAEEVRALPVDFVVRAVNENVEARVGRAQVLMQATYGNVVAISEHASILAGDSGAGESEQPIPRPTLLVSSNNGEMRSEAVVVAEIDRARTELARANAICAMGGAGTAALRKVLDKQEVNINQLSREVEEERKCLLVLKERVKERDLEVESLVRLASEHEGKISGLNQSIEERDRHIAKLNEAVIERDRQISSVNQAVAERDGQINQLKRYEIELSMFRARRLVRLMDIIVVEPWGLRKIANVIYLLTPNILHPLIKKFRLFLGIESIRQTSRVEVAPQTKEFDQDFYLNNYPDISAAGVNPYEHYLQHGRSEGRLGKMPEIPVIGSFDALDTDRDTVLVVSHIGTRTGAPILSYNLVKSLLKKYNVVALFLGPGPLLEACHTAGAIVVGPVALQASVLAPRLVVKKIADAVQVKFALINSVESRCVMEALANRYIPTVCLIHEFATNIKPQWAVPEAVFWSGQTVFSTRITHDNAVAEFPYLSAPGTQEYPVLPQGRCVLPAENYYGGEKRGKDASFIRRVIRPEGFATDGVVLIGIGSVCVRKGVDLFIQCAAHVLQKASDLPCRFVWVGQGYDPDSDTAYSVFLADQVRRAGLEKHVYFLDEVADLDAVYALADILVLSSRLDPLPNVAIDALTNGLPIVCFDKTTGMVEILNEHRLRDACVAAYLDVEDMARKVVALAESKDLRKRVSDCSAEVASATFDMAKYVTQVEQLAIEEVERAQQEKLDVETILKSDLPRLDFFLPAHLQKKSREEAIRFYVRSWASGVWRRKLFPGFCPGIYLERHGVEKAGVDPLADYLRAGQPEGPWRFDLITSDEKPIPIPQELRVGMHIHAYYVDLLPEIIERIEKNQVRPDLLISVMSESARREVAGITEHYRGRVDIRIVPNRGRDIGPFLTEFGETIHRQFDLIGHIHTKKTEYHKDAEVGRVWFQFLLENLLGRQVPMADIILGRMAADQNIGLVFPDDPNSIGWDGNASFAENLPTDLEINKSSQELVFPVGVMFWARPSGLKQLFDLGLKWEDYPSEPLPYNVSVLHALERMFGLFVIRSGGTILLTNVPGKSR